jgi:hypothetical protein
VINFVQKEHGTNLLQDDTVVTYIKLLRQLCKAIEREQLSNELIADIKVPDRHGRLTDIDGLCMVWPKDFPKTFFEWPSRICFLTFRIPNFRPRSKSNKSCVNFRGFDEFTFSISINSPSISVSLNCKSLFDKSWEPLQGPAILVYSDKPFTKEDIEGIQQLGLGSKGHDATKTGQYGVGFNSVIFSLVKWRSDVLARSNVRSGSLNIVPFPFISNFSW